MELFRCHCKQIQDLKEAVPSSYLIPVSFPCSSCISPSTPEAVRWVRRAGKLVWKESSFEFIFSWIVELTRLSVWFHRRMDCPFHWLYTLRSLEFTLAVVCQEWCVLFLCLRQCKETQFLSLNLPFDWLNKGNKKGRGKGFSSLTYNENCTGTLCIGCIKVGVFLNYQKN